MRIRHRLVFSLLITLAGSLQIAGADDAAPPEIERFLYHALSVDGAWAHWLTDTDDPADASEAIGIVYSENTNGGNSIDMDVGYFRRSGARFKLQGRVKNLFGMSPRNVVFRPQRIELTTTMPESGAVRWSIDRQTLEARQRR